MVVHRNRDCLLSRNRCEIDAVVAAVSLVVLAVDDVVRVHGPPATFSVQHLAILIKLKSWSYDFVNDALFEHLISTNKDVVRKHSV